MARSEGRRAGRRSRLRVIGWNAPCARSRRRRFAATTRPVPIATGDLQPQERAGRSIRSEKTVDALSWKPVSTESSERERLHGSGSRPPLRSDATSQSYDLAVVGAGICGLAHALAAARRGKSVVVIDRDAQANGASIRNFGFVTVTGQQRGECWRRAMRSRDVWVEVADAAEIAIVHRGLVAIARRPEARAVLEAFLPPEMGEACRSSSRGTRLRLGSAGGRLRRRALQPARDRGSNRATAIPRSPPWLAERARRHLLCARRSVHAGAPPKIETAAGAIEAERGHRLPGRRFLDLFPERLAHYGLTRCKLHMLRLAPHGLTSVRRRGHVRSRPRPLSRLCRAAGGGGAGARLEAEQREHLANGVHLIVVRSADGSLVVGDSHHYAATPDPFAPDGVDDLILDEFRPCVRWRATAGGRALDRHLCVGARPPGAGRPPVPTRCASS